MRFPATNMTPVAPARAPGFWRSCYAIGLLVMGTVAGYFLWSTVFGEKGDPHFGLLHIASYIFLAFGFILLSNAWRVLYHAQRSKTLATTGPYARIRHPPYLAFVMILLGFLLQWPTLLTLLMFPVLLVMYGRLALTEEADMRALFGQAYERYARVTPRYFPKLSRRMAAPD